MSQLRLWPLLLPLARRQHTQPADVEPTAAAEAGWSVTRALILPTFKRHLIGVDAVGAVEQADLTHYSNSRGF